jgi:peptidoglycan-associated lipoprotein
LLQIKKNFMILMIKLEPIKLLRGKEMHSNILSLVAVGLLVTACESASDKRINSANDYACGHLSSEKFKGLAPGSSEHFVNMSQDRVFFSFNKYMLDHNAMRVLDSQARWLRQHPSVQLVIEGHCDERGTREYNLALGEKRANETKKYLVGRGVSAASIQIVSYGKERPVAVGHDDDAWTQNRVGVSVVQ